MRSAPSRRTVLLIAAAALLPAVAAAQGIEVKDAWTRATAPGQKTGGVFMQLRSAQGATLVSAQSTAATTVEVHEMSMDGNVMRMRAIPKLELPAGQTVEPQARRLSRHADRPEAAAEEGREGAGDAARRGS
jgi:copper(I)-binding protein